MAEEFVSAFRATDNEKLVEFVYSYYVNNLNSPEFCSALQLRLNPTNNQQPGNNPTLIAQNFLQDISRLHSKHLTTEMELITLEKKLSKQLHSVAVSKKLYSLLFNGPILFAAVGRWRRSVLVKRETALKKRKVIVDRMILVARPIVTGLDSIVNAARGLEVEIKSLSEADDAGEKVAAVENCFEELLQNDEKYNSVINCAKELVLQSIVLVGNKGTVNLCQLTGDEAEKNAHVSVESCVSQSLNEVKATSDLSMPCCQVIPSWKDVLLKVSTNLDKS